MCILLLLDFALYPCTFMRNDIHAVANNTYDDVYMGTSHGKMNIDPSAVLADSGRTGHNICVGGEYSIDTYYMIRMMVERGHKPERIVYELSPGYYVREKEEGNNYLLFFHEFPLGKTKIAYFADAIAGCNFRTLLFPWYEYSLSYEIPRVAQTVSTRVRQDYSVTNLKSASQEYHESGFIARYPVDTSTFTTVGIKISSVDEILPENMAYLKKLIDLCKAEDIEFKAVTTPLPLPLLQSGAQQYTEVWEYFNAFFEEAGVSYLNFNDMEHFGLFTHEMPAFTDMDGHMNEDAARAFSRVLAQAL